MAEKSTLARPYAQAVFNLAKESDSLDVWSGTLMLLTQVVTHDEVACLISNPHVPKETVIKLITDIGGENLDEQAVNFVRLLAENKKLVLLPQIAEQYEILKADEQGTLEAEVISAYAINAAQKKKIASALQNKLGREISIKTRTDKSLLGGMIIRAGDLVIDGSVATQLRRFTQTLLS